MNTDNEVNNIVERLTQGGMCFGYVEEIHGEGGKCQSVTITRHEAEIIVQRHLADIAEIEVMWMTEQAAGSSDMRLRRFSVDRINELIEAGIITVERVQEMMCACEAIYQRRSLC